MGLAGCRGRGSCRADGWRGRAVSGCFWRRSRTGTEGAATWDVLGTAVDPDMLLAMPGLPWHGEQPQAPRVPAPALHLALPQWGDLKHRPRTETQEREGALDPCEGRGGLGGSRLRAMRAGAKPRRVAAAKGGQRGERWARGCPAVPERPGMLPAARREGLCRGPGTAAQVPVSRTPRSLFAFSPLTVRWSKGAGVVLLCCRCLCASWQGLPAAGGRGCKSERRGFCPRKRRWGAGSGRGQSAGREYLL